jgi:hypothetical protein
MTVYALCQCREISGTTALFWAAVPFQIVLSDPFEQPYWKIDGDQTA